MEPIPISVVIPVAPQDDAWSGLLPQLELPVGSEVILALGEGGATRDLPEPPAGIDLQQCSGGRGRAGQMNSGAKQANHPFLWFLHADSRIAPTTINELVKAVSSGRDGLYFFDLQFLDDGPAAMRLNQWAVHWRSVWMKMPFGDQGFVIRKDLFENLGMYREDLAYGEDHVFVWKARQEGCPVLRIPAPLLTSARKYQRRGWAQTTLLHVWLTWRQAVPQWILLMQRRLLRAVSGESR